MNGAEEQKLRGEILRMRNEGKTIKEIKKILKISNKTYYKIMNEKTEDGKAQETKKETPMEELKKTTNDKISYEPEEMSLVMQAYMEATKFKFSTMSEYMDWRSRLIPFLSKVPQEGRELLYNLAAITVLIGSTGTTRIMIQMIFRKVLDSEMTERIREIEQLRKPRQA